MTRFLESWCKFRPRSRGNGRPRRFRKPSVTVNPVVGPGGVPVGEWEGDTHRDDPRRPRLRYPSWPVWRITKPGPRCRGLPSATVVPGTEETWLSRVERRPVTRVQRRFSQRPFKNKSKNYVWALPCVKLLVHRSSEKVLFVKEKILNKIKIKIRVSYGNYLFVEE